MTADALRDRIAAAWSDHETGALHPEGYVPCSCRTGAGEGQS